jgi:plasmid maintenance system antidote protein VapI
MSRTRRVTFLIGANIKNFEDNLEQAGRRMERFGRDMQRFGRTLSRNITAPLLAMGGGILAIQKQTGEFADRILDLSQITGLSTDALQEWRNVARVAGVDAEFVSNVVSGLSRRMRGISEESGKAHQAAQQLGISFKDANGQIRSTDQVMTEAIARLSEMDSGLERAAIANDLFGRRWEQLAPVLGLTSDEIAHARQQAHDLGLVMDQEALEAAAKFREEFSLLGEQTKALGRDFAMDMLPIVRDDVIPLFRDFMETVRNVAQRFSALDRETQKSIIRWGAYLAAAGPILMMVGRLIALTGTLMINKAALTKTTRSLTAAMMKNPFILAAAGAAYLTRQVYLANASISQLNELIDQTLNLQPEGTREELEQVAHAIAAVEERLDQTRKMFKSMDMDPAGQEQTRELEKQKRELIQLREQIALAMSARARADEKAGEGSGVYEELTGLYEDQKSAIDDLAGSYSGLTAEIHSNNERIDELINKKRDLTEEEEKELVRLGGINHSLQVQINLRRELARQTENAADQLERARDALRDIIELQNREADDPTADMVRTFAEIEQQINQIEISLNRMNLEIEQTGRSAQFAEALALDFIDSFGSGMTNVIVQAESLLQTLENIGRLLGSSAIQMGIRMLLTGGFGGGITGGLFGRIFGVNDALIRSDGSIVRFHQDDNILAMRDFSRLIPSQIEAEYGSGAVMTVSGPVPTVSRSSTKEMVNVIINMNSREVARALAEVDFRKGRG